MKRPDGHPYHMRSNHHSAIFRYYDIRKTIQNVTKDRKEVINMSKTVDYFMQYVQVDTQSSEATEKKKHIT